jgi:hypothetical protein
MSRNGAGVYSLPAGSTVTNGDVSDATDINTPLADIAADLNVARPIVAGGTGAVTAAAALVNLGLTATAAEINIMDGVTASTAELNILDGVTSTAAELNILDGATLTVTELNYVDGVTSAIQTQLDAKQPLDADLTALAGISGTEGDIIYRNATQWTRLAKGTATQVLAMNAGATAPAWATAGVGGGQTWQDVKASRALSTTYTNSTGKPIFVSIAVVWGNATGSVTLTIDGIIVQKFWSNPDSSDMSLSVSAIVPNGSTYSVAQTSNVAAGVIEYWAELR